MNHWTNPNANVYRRHFVGLDLGQVQDPTALAVVEATEEWDDETEAWEPLFGVRHLQRWPLGTRYPVIVRDVKAMLDSSKLIDAALIVDRTGVGTPVIDMIVEADVKAVMKQVHITAGSTSRNENGIDYVPKKELVSALQVPMQKHRLKVSKLPERTVLEKELLNFRSKITAAANEVFGAWREGQNDDLVLAVALAVWAAQSAPRNSGAEPFGIENLTLGEVLGRSQRLPGRNSYPSF